MIANTDNNRFEIYVRELCFIKMFSARVRKGWFIKNLKKRDYFFSKETIDFYKKQEIFYFDFAKK
jgi:hypothetical protein